MIPRLHLLLIALVAFLMGAYVLAVLSFIR